MLKRNIFCVLIISLAVLASASIFANQKLDGSWKGSIGVNEKQLIEVIFNFEKNEQGYTATLDVPAQKQFGLPFSSVSIDGNNVSLELKVAQISYRGKLTEVGIVGEYKQASFRAPLTLIATTDTTTRTIRKQEPQGVLPYTNEQVTFHNKPDNITLSGTLSIPNNNVKAAVILLSGSGPTSRDADVAGHKLFLVLADLLTRQGIAVLRYDDRGVGASTGNFNLATSADFAKDAKAALSFLQQHPQFAKSKIGYIGHSEGGLIGAIAQAKYQGADFFISMAGVGTSGAQVIIDQSYHIQKQMGMEQQALLKDDRDMREVMAAIEQGANQQQLIQLIQQQGYKKGIATTKAKTYSSPWFNYFIKAQPAQFLTEINIPVFAINGELDSQVLPEKNLEVFDKTISKEQLTTKVYPNLNHLFQPAQTGLPNEYMEIEITISEQVVSDIVMWIEQHI